MGAHPVIFGTIPIIPLTLGTKRRPSVSPATFLLEYRFFMTEGDLLLFDGGARAGLTNRVLTSGPDRERRRTLLLGRGAPTNSTPREGRSPPSSMTGTCAENRLRPPFADIVERHH